MVKLNSIPNSLYLLSGRIILGLGQLLMLRVLTGILDSSEMGKYYLVMSIISGMILLLINPVSQYIQRHLHGWNREGMARIAGYRFLILLAGIAIGTSIMMWGINFFSLMEFDLPLIFLVLVIPLLVVFVALTGLLPGLCNILGKYKAFVILSNMDLWGKIGLVGLFAVLFPDLVTTVLLAVVCWSVISVLISGRYFYGLLNKPIVGQNTLDLKMVKNDLFAFVWPLAIAAGLYWGQSEGYRFILQRTVGVDVVGKFVVAFNLGAALMIAVDTLFHQLYLPKFYQEISAETDKGHIDAWNKYAKKVTGVCIPVGLYIACAGPFLARWFLHENYWDMGIYAAFGAISQLFRIISAAFYYGIVARKTTNLLILPYIFGTMVALVGTFFLSKQFPIQGTGSALIFSYVIVCILSYIQLKRKLDIQIPWSRIGEAILFCLPLCFLLLIAYKFGLDLRPMMNLFLLALTGLGMLAIQWRLAGDVWFQSGDTVDIRGAG
ncbi:lipopolysaccharide biosynthesis protein [Thermodesulfobacteriota bacterium]